MDSTTLWWWFWEICFVVAGGSFALIAAVVAVRGVADLRGMIEILRREKKGRTPDALRRNTY
jgi:hypothetical protein